MRGRGELDEVLVAGIIFGQQGEVIALIIDAGFFLKAGAISDIDFAADDRLEAVLDALVVELDRAVHRTMISERDGRHAMLLRQLHHVVHFGQSVQKTVMRVRMKMDEFAHEIWRDSSAQLMLAKFPKTSRDHPSLGPQKKRVCRSLSLLLGPCRARSLLIHGILHKRAILVIRGPLRTLLGLTAGFRELCFF